MGALPRAPRAGRRQDASRRRHTPRAVPAWSGSRARNGKTPNTVPTNGSATPFPQTVPAKRDGAEPIRPRPRFYVLPPAAPVCEVEPVDQPAATVNGARDRAELVLIQVCAVLRAIQLLAGLPGLLAGGLDDFRMQGVVV